MTNKDSQNLVFGVLLGALLGSMSNIWVTALFYYVDPTPIWGLIVSVVTLILWIWFVYKVYTLIKHPS